jgi:Tfp pilus assembly protein PilE
VTLLEIVVVMAVIGVLLSFSTNSYHRSVEQARADIAGANLIAIWNAQRMHWLEFRSYSDSLQELERLGLLDASIVSGSQHYRFRIDAADALSFSATATRIGSRRWGGQFQIDEQGQTTGEVSMAGERPVRPGYS